MRESRLRGSFVGYRGNGSGIKSEPEDCERVVGKRGGEWEQGEAGSTEPTAGLSAAEQPLLPVLGSLAEGWWQDELHIYQEL